MVGYSLQLNLRKDYSLNMSFISNFDIVLNFIQILKGS